MKQKSKHIILTLLALSQFLVVLDGAIINVALPAIQQALNFDSASLQWVVTAYILTFGGFLMLGGRAADLFGRRRVLVAGMAGFVAVSFLMGLSQSAGMLIALRAVQGLTAAFMAPAALSILLTTFSEGAERNRALAVWAVVASGGAAAGVFLGGLITELLGWQWNFFVNVPVGILAIIGLMRYLPAHIAEEKDKHLDLPGAALVTGSLMSLVYALTHAAESGWTEPLTIGLLTLSVVLMVGFVLNERRAKHPLVPFSIFKIRNLAGGNLLMLPVMAGALGLFFFSSQYVQTILGYKPIEAGLAFLPIPIVIGIVSNRAPKLIAKFGFKPLLVLGTALVSFATFTLSFLTADSSYWLHLLPSFAVMATGMGLLFVSVTVAATTGVPGHEAGLASGLLNTSQQVGGALGMAILAVVASAASKSSLESGAALTQAALHGYRQAFLWASMLMVISLIIAIFVIRAPKKNLVEKTAKVISAH